MKRWELVKKYKDWRGRYKISCKTFETEKALRKAVAKASLDLKRIEEANKSYTINSHGNEVEYSIRVWDLAEEFSMESYLTEQNRANQIGTVFGDVDPRIAELGSELARIFSKDYPAMVEEWGMLSKTSKKELSAFFSTYRTDLQLYPVCVDGVDHVAWWDLLLSQANYVKLTTDRVYYGRGTFRAAAEHLEQFDDALKRKRKRK